MFVTVSGYERLEATQLKVIRDSEHGIKHCNFPLPPFLRLYRDYLNDRCGEAGIQLDSGYTTSDADHFYLDKSHIM